MAGRVAQWRGVVPRLALSLVLVALAALALSTLGTRPPRGVDAPEGEFSAGRAVDHLEAIAAAPRPHGSAANQRTADYIVGLADDLGLRTEVDRVPGASSIHATVPGTESTGLVVLTAHFDSATGAPGAGDDGLGVVALLETMRVLASDPPLRNDTLFLFTDGEETGREGSASFVGSSTAHDGAVVIAMEGEPGGGPTTLQQTSPGSGWLMSQVAAADVPAWAASSGEDPERADDDSDFDVLSAGGLAGVEFANPKDATRYHTPRDVIGAVDPSLVQSHGETALRLARRLGAQDLTEMDRDNDAVYVTLPMTGIVTYTESLADGSALLAAVSAIAAVVAAVATGRTTARRLAASVGVAVGVVALLSAVAQFGWDALSSALAPDDIVAFADFDHSAGVMLGIMTGAAVAAMIVAGRWSHRSEHDSVDVAAASLALLLIAHLVRFAELPLGSPVTTWPLLAASLSFGAWLWLPRVVSHLVLALAAASAVLLLTPQLILQAASPGDGAGPAVAMTLLLLACLAPQLLAIAGASPRPISSTTAETNGAQPPRLTEAAV